MRQQVISGKGKRKWQGIPAIERAANGRLWCSFFSGGDDEPEVANYIMLTTSDDDGRSWSEPEIFINPDGGWRAYDPALWHAPDGKLWLFYNESNLQEQTFLLRAMVTENSDDAAPIWSEPVTIDVDAPFAFRLNKPTVLSSGEWLLPVTWSRTAPDDWFAGAGQLQGVAISADQGLSWKLHGAVEAPNWALENMIIERTDGALWMPMRSGSGVLWESVSTDKGLTWSEGAPTGIVNPGTRFFMRRLASGRILFINSPHPTKRDRLCAYLSDRDDGAGFDKEFELDSREKVSYPDAVQVPDGLIYAVYDRERYGVGEIILSVFSETEMLDT